MVALSNEYKSPAVVAIAYSSPHGHEQLQQQHSVAAVDVTYIYLPLDPPPSSPPDWQLPAPAPASAIQQAWRDTTALCCAVRARAKGLGERGLVASKRQTANEKWGALGIPSRGYPHLGGTFHAPCCSLLATAVGTPDQQLFLAENRKMRWVLGVDMGHIQVEGRRAS